MLPESSSSLKEVLSHFRTVGDEEIASLLRKAPSKSCELDPFPSFFMKSCSVGSNMFDHIKFILNSSLKHGKFPSAFKQAIVRPLLKKQGLDYTFGNYRPVSNLSFMSKLIERAVTTQLVDHLERNGLAEKYQSAYKSFHSTETALLCVQTDILKATDENSMTMLLLLDLSAAFDTVDFNILLSRLRNCGIRDNSLSWFQDYLTGRSQVVCVQKVKSSPKELKCGVPQGSVLGPLLFSIYTAPLGELVRKHGISYHFYADDSQLYLSFTSSSQDSAVANMGACIQDIRVWMHANKLKLNDSKSEFMILGSRAQVDKVSLDSVLVGNNVVLATDKVRNLGVILDPQLKMHHHVNYVCKSAYFHLRNIRHIRHCLTPEATNTLVHSLVTSRLDYGNALLYGISKSLVKKLQMVQNSAARLVCGVKKFDHITPVLRHLHWLPFEFRIKYKILLLTFKALNGMGPSYIRDMLNSYHPNCNLRSSNKFLLKVPRSRLVSGADRSFSVVAPKLWNELPISLKLCKTLESFKSALKTHLFKAAFK